MVIPPGFTKDKAGGIMMKSENLWQAFLDTGAPEIYVLYAQAKKVEENHVFNGSGSCAESDQL